MPTYEQMAELWETEMAMNRWKAEANSRPLNSTNSQSNKSIMANKYRKKPVVIEAVQYHGDNKGEIEDFAGITLETKGEFLMIPTLESPHEASRGDFIIRGISGEVYPCKPDIFEKTYEKVPDNSNLK